MRVRQSQYVQMVLTTSLLITSHAYASSPTANFPIFLSDAANCGAAADWGTYFNGVLGGVSLTLLLVMLIKIPNSVRQSFKKKHALE